MESSTAAASTLSRQRISVAILSLAAISALGYSWYRIYNPLPDPEGARLHRSNAFRNRRRADRVASRQSQNHDNEQQHRDPASEGSSATLDEQGANAGAADENNIEIDNTRPVQQLTDGETVAEGEHVMDDDWYNREILQQQQQRAGHNIVGLLFRVSEDNARRTAYVHRGCQCNACGIVPIRGVRYRCANCADFDLCETCESQNLHTKTHIFYKIKIPAPRLGPRQMQPVWYPGDPESVVRNLPRNLIAKLSKETGLERPELEAFWEQWTFMANTEWREDPDELYLAMDRTTFERYMVPSGGSRNTMPNLLYERMFAFFDTNNDDLIGFTEFLHGTAYRKRRDRLQRIFEGYDVDGDGYVNRRDFLRLFRAYYVLFREMHKDMLEGIDDQVLSSVELQQLVTSRQPLSSHFGREGGVPAADGERAAEGKVVNDSTGDVLIADGRNRAVKEDKSDTVDRNTLLSSLYTREEDRAHEFSWVLENVQTPDPESAARYFHALLNPPSRVEDLPALLTGHTNATDGFLFVSNVQEDDQEDSDDDEQDAGGPSNGQVVDSEEAEPSDNALAAWPLPSGAQEERPMSPGETQRQMEQRAQEIRQARADQLRNQRMAANRRNRNVRRKLFDRWKKRQFYLDEEEGAEPPDGWDEDDDILTGVNGHSDNHKTTQHPPMLSPRSRSSSKVRFAEDTDDYDIRSNPSTSSRSVPERWGGMEIPDAERDVGKEVFYQVIQQAFNELLDDLFREKEDLAVEAAETKEDRDKHRHLFEHIDPNSVMTSEAAGISHQGPHRPRHSASSPDPHYPPGDHRSIPERNLEELLSAAGYTIRNGNAQVEEEEGEEESGDSEEESEGDEDEADSNKENRGDVTPWESVSQSWASDKGAELAGQQHQREVEETLATEDEEERHHQKSLAELYRDPTFPQFRPNSAASEEQPQTSDAPTKAAIPSSSSSSELYHPAGYRGTPSSSSSHSQQQPQKHNKENNPPLAPITPTTTQQRPQDEKKEEEEEKIPLATLARWKRLDLAEEEAKARGGWGRLSFAEFEEIYHREEANGNRLDYLSTWIDFCIPWH